MLDGIGFIAGHYETSKSLDFTTLRPLGRKLVHKVEAWAVMNANSEPDFWYNKENL